MKLFAVFRAFEYCKKIFAGWIVLSLMLFSFHILDPGEESAVSQNDTVTAPAVSDTAAPTEQNEKEDAPQPENMTLKTEEENAKISLVYYNQKDDIWKESSYGSDSISGYGCGPTACAILISTLTDQTVTPADMAEWSVQNGCYIEGGGSYHMLIPLACKSYGLTVTGYTGSQREEILDALRNGSLVSVIMGPGHFTESGHFIVLYGITEEGKILVSDPASRENSEKEWDADIIFEEARSYAAGGGPFWAVTR